MFEEKVAIITGSTSGIGECTARMLSALGMYVVINSVSSIKKGNELAEELINAIYVQGDISIEKDCKNIINETIKQFGRIDVLINNAGKSVSSSENILDISNKDFSETLDINVVGTWCLTREAIPHLKKTGNGNIINITAGSGVDPAQAESGIQYAVAKAAVNHLTKFLAKYCGPEIRANAIAPGIIMTQRAEKYPEVVEKLKHKIPLNRVGTPADISELIIGIIKSNYINGEVILADGGFSTI